MQGIHVPAAKFFPLQGINWLGLVLLMDLSEVASTIHPVVAGEAGRATRSVDHQALRRWITAIALGCGLRGARQQIEQAVESFVGLDCHDLMGGRM